VPRPSALPAQAALLVHFLSMPPREHGATALATQVIGHTLGVPVDAWTVKEARFDDRHCHPPTPFASLLISVLGRSTDAFGLIVPCCNVHTLQIVLVGAPEPNLDSERADLIPPPRMPRAFRVPVCMAFQSQAPTLCIAVNLPQSFKIWQVFVRGLQCMHHFSFCVRGLTRRSTRTPTGPVNSCL
jgi:hypothetical protein